MPNEEEDREARANAARQAREEASEMAAQHRASALKERNAALWKMAKEAGWDDAKMARAFGDQVNQINDMVPMDSEQLDAIETEVRDDLDLIRMVKGYGIDLPSLRDMAAAANVTPREFALALIRGSMTHSETAQPAGASTGDVPGRVATGGGAAAGGTPQVQAGPQLVIGIEKGNSPPENGQSN